MLDISFAHFNPTVKQNEEQIVNMDGMEKSGNLKMCTGKPKKWISGERIYKLQNFYVF